MELVVLNIGLEAGILGARSFSVMVIMCIFTTVLACPLVQCIYPPSVRTYMEAKRSIEGQEEGGVVGTGVAGVTDLHQHADGEDCKVDGDGSREDFMLEFGCSSAFSSSSALECEKEY